MMRKFSAKALLVVLGTLGLGACNQTENPRIYLELSNTTNLSLDGGSLVSTRSQVPYMLASYMALGAPVPKPNSLDDDFRISQNFLSSGDEPVTATVQLDLSSLKLALSNIGKAPDLMEEGDMAIGTEFEIPVQASVVPTSFNVSYDYETTAILRVIDFKVPTLKSAQGSCEGYSPLINNFNDGELMTMELSFEINTDYGVLSYDASNKLFVVQVIVPSCYL